MASGVLHLELAPTEALLKLIDAGEEVIRAAGGREGFCLLHLKVEPVTEGCHRRAPCIPENGSSEADPPAATSAGPASASSRPSSLGASSTSGESAGS